MAKIVKTPETIATIICEYCSHLTFKRIQDFVRHLREQHCTIEGGSYVCRYGYNDVCSSLPLEGVSDKDYIMHATKHAALQQQRKANGQINDSLSQWTVYSAVQNLPAVLNDPRKGKQSNFLTKTWGDAFIEKVDIPKSPYLPDITIHHFDSYMQKIVRRYRKHSRSSGGRPNSPNNDTSNFSTLKKSAKSLERSSQFDLGSIPKIFLTPSLDLSHPSTFSTVFPFTTSGLLNPSTNIVTHVKNLQEKLSHYLDIVEVRIAEQVASKSQAFFIAMTSHDALMEQLTQTITVLKALRSNIHQIDKTLVQDSLSILRLERSRCNRLLVHEKLKLMATVHQSQPMIQLLLSTPDYVAALDLISTTQEILHQELNGIQSFRHLSSQLTEMERLVDKMLSTEFERYSTADLNRPLTSDTTVLDGDKLVSIISGLLRQKHFQFVDTYKEEAITTIRAVTKQRVIEALAASDCCSDQQAAALEVGGLSLPERLALLQSTIQSLTYLLYRVKAVYEVMKDTVDLSVGPAEDNLILDRRLTTEEYSRVITKLSDMLTSVCDYCHERLGNLLAAGGDADKGQIDRERTPEGKGEREGWSEKGSWLSDKATASQVCQLAGMVERFTETCEGICGKQCTALRSAFKAQASKFVQRFHNERKNKLGLLLESERWKQAEVPKEFQRLVTFVFENRRFPMAEEVYTGEGEVGSCIFVGEEQFAVVGTVLMLIQMIHEYCRTAEELKALSGAVGRQLAELLRHYNSRCCQLVLGAGAMHVAGLKTITSTILVLAARSLKLVLWLMPFVKAHFQELANHSANRSAMGSSGGTGGVALLDSLERDVRSHIREIEGKILTIVDNLVGGQISSWDARPPVPSQSFRNISRHLIKLHEAVSGILPPVEVQVLYRTVNVSFKEKLREQLVKMNIVNNGGPQHGVVTSELTFYLQALRNLKVLPADELNDEWMSDIWSR
ncbi:vacuolar protein sorting-associated protein 54 isoform X1 [Diachasmimorpha longicaudata]|uniref:vacuolar protein sorting-associated protein 54 isoform X1 n=2 Tax=Diachasmimorpha longicaudata TaxID=58733 RepID=UPI0030B899BE